jgi:aspartate aminotransferase-like enzyme
MKGKLFRIAHIGYYDYLDTVGILAALEQVLNSVAGKQIQYGTSVRAAQEVFAHSQNERANVEAGAAR